MEEMIDKRKRTFDKASYANIWTQFIRNALLQYAANEDQQFVRSVEALHMALLKDERTNVDKVMGKIDNAVQAQKNLSIHERKVLAHKKLLEAIVDELQVAGFLTKNTIMEIGGIVPTMEATDED